MAELAWAIALEVSHMRAQLGPVAPWRSRLLHKMLMTTGVRRPLMVVLPPA